MKATTRQTSQSPHHRRRSLAAVLLSLFAGIIGATAQPATSVITSDADVDTTGPFVYAINVGSTGNPATVGEAVFLPGKSGVPGYTETVGAVLAGCDLQGWAGSAALKDVLDAPGYNWGDMSFTLAVVPGTTYRLQLLIANAWGSDPNLKKMNTDIYVEDTPIADDFDINAHLSDAETWTRGVLVSCEFTAADAILNIDFRDELLIAGNLTMLSGITLKSLSGAADSDGDGLPDDWEMLYFGDLSKTGTDDPDGDGLNNAAELDHKSNPSMADSDSDGLSDGEEVNTYHTDPLAADSDTDGLADGAEVTVHHTDPAKRDTDGDRLTDGREINTTHTDPLKKDTDGDGADDTIEVLLRTDPLDAMSRPTNPTMSFITGGDPGEGLDLQGNISALNIGNQGDGGLAGDAFFAADDAPGATVSGIPVEYFPSVEFGSSPNDEVLERVMRSIRYGASQMTVQLTGLEIGANYKLQLFTGERITTPRAFDISVNGTLVLHDLVLQAEGNVPMYACVTYQFTAASGTLDIVLDGTNSTVPADHNPVLCGLTLEKLSTSAQPPSLTVTPAANGQLTISTDGVLQQADEATGPFVSLTTSTVTVDPKTAGARKFWRAVR